MWAFSLSSSSLTLLDDGLSFPERERVSLLLPPSNREEEGTKEQERGPSCKSYT